MNIALREPRDQRARDFIATHWKLGVERARVLRVLKMDTLDSWWVDPPRVTGTKGTGLNGADDRRLQDRD